MRSSLVSILISNGYEILAPNKRCQCLVSLVCCLSAVFLFVNKHSSVLLYLMNPTLGFHNHSCSVLYFPMSREFSLNEGLVCIFCVYVQMHALVLRIIPVLMTFKKQ